MCKSNIPSTSTIMGDQVISNRLKQKTSGWCGKRENRLEGFLKASRDLQSQPSEPAYKQHSWLWLISQEWHIAISSISIPVVVHVHHTAVPIRISCTLPPLRRFPQREILDWCFSVEVPQGWNCSVFVLPNMVAVCHMLLLGPWIVARNL